MTEETQLREATWKLLVEIDAHDLVFPIAISPQRYPCVALQVQVEASAFKSYFARIESAAVRSELVDGDAHVHVIGKLRGVDVRLVCVMRQQDEAGALA